jgi:hypothetical protein
MRAQPREFGERRSAQNQALFRDGINERIEARASRWPALAGSLQHVICECSLADCREPLAMTAAEYDEVHRTDARFCVAPGHDDLEFERVVERHATYWFVEKFEPIPRQDTRLSPGRPQR